MRADNLYALPEDLPAPEDDGTCDHLSGLFLPSIGSRATSGKMVDSSKEGSLGSLTTVTHAPDELIKNHPAGWRRGTPYPLRAVVHLSPVPIATTTPSLPVSVQRFMA